MSQRPPSLLGKFFTGQLQTHWGLDYCVWQRCSHHLPITLRSLCRPSPPPFWTLHISLPFAKGSWEPNGKPERWFLAQTIHRSILSSLGEFWDYRSMRLDYKSYLISQTHIAYISLCGSSRASSVVFLVVWRMPIILFGAMAKYLSKAGK